jgi:DNA-binding transcriptional regulator LsrR (DeoR family)
LPKRSYVPKHDRDLETWQAIHLHVERDLSASEIAKRLHLDTRTVKDRLRYGRDQHWWSVEMDRRLCPRQKLLASLYPLDDRSALCAQLRRQTRATALRKVLVFHNPSRQQDTETVQQWWARRIEMLGLAAGAYLASIFTSGKVTSIGVGWGETTSAVIDGIGLACDDRTVRAADVHCVATFGELVGETRVQRDVSSSALTERLSVSLNGNGDFSHTLRGVPAVIPFSVPLHEVDVCRKMIQSYPNVAAILGRSGLAEGLQGIVTSAGNREQDNKYWRRELLRAGYSSDLLSTLDIIDIGGTLIEPKSLDKNSQPLFEELFRRSIGLSEMHYRRLTKQFPGVVLCCLDRNKKDVVTSCLTHDLVTMLIIDSDLAAALEASCR